MVQFCTTYWAGKHASSTAALRGYTGSIISFIKSLLVPISLTFVFLIVMLKHFLSISSCY